MSDDRRAALQPNGDLIEHIGDCDSRGWVA